MGKIIYLDNNASTAVDEYVREKMSPFFSCLYSNPSALYYNAQQVRGQIEKAREQIAAAINASADEIIFTSGGTEADNTAVKGRVGALREKSCHIITSQIEHHAILSPVKFLEIQGCDVTYLPVDENGLIDPDDLRKNIRQDTVLISVMSVNNETGVIQPLEEIGEIAAGNNIPFHTDAVQACGKINIDVQRDRIDLLSLSGHKIYGPKGIGLLYARKGIDLIPLHHGGHHERYRRAGTENVPGIIGLSTALEIMNKEWDNNNRRIAELKNRLESELLDSYTDIRINGLNAPRVSNTINFSIKNVSAQDIIMALDQKGFCLSSGSACSSGIPEPSHVLQAMHIPEEYIHGTIRISLGKYNTEEEISSFIREFRTILPKVRK